MNATPYIEALGKETGMDITLSASGAAALSLGGRNLMDRSDALLHRIC